MANPVPPKYGVAYVFYTGLMDQAAATISLKANPTLSAGDVKISKDGGAFANITTLPTVTPAAGRAVKVSLSATEMSADHIVVQFVDAAGAEWCDKIIDINTTARGTDDLMYLNRRH